MGLVPLISKIPDTLEKVALVITNLITIYESDMEESHVVFLITNEVVT